MRGTTGRIWPINTKDKILSEAEQILKINPIWSSKDKRLRKSAVLMSEVCVTTAVTAYLHFQVSAKFENATTWHSPMTNYPLGTLQNHSPKAARESLDLGVSMTSSLGAPLG